MPLPVEVLAREVLRLPTVERAKLLEWVIDSLDADRGRDAKCNALAAQRDAQADADPSILMPGFEVLARLRAAIN